MNREKKLFSNFLTFMVGSVGSKLLQFLLVPFYTSILSTGEYGTVDLLQTVGMLIVPIFSLTIAESVFRYGMEKYYDNKEVFSIGIAYTLVGSGILVILGFITSALFGNLVLIFLTIGYGIFNMLRSVTSQFLRAIGKTKLFTVDNVLQTCLILGFNLLFLLVFKWGVVGYLLGYILGNLISFLFGMYGCGLSSYLVKPSKDKGIKKEMLKYSVPLIPNTICWWISSSTDKFMLSAIKGVAYNGIYTVAHKMPSIITIVVNVFIQAWQISANEEFDNKDKKEFYSKIFRTLSFLSFFLASFLILFVKLEIRILAPEKEYFPAWESTIVLIIGIAFFTFAQFLGTLYTANKKTEMAFVTNLIAAVINVIGNALLIPRYGVVGAAIATSFSYFCLWIIRVWNTKKIVKLTYDYLNLILCSIVLVFQGVVQLFEVKYWQLYGSICLAIIILLNVSQVKGLLNFFIKRDV